MYIDELEKKIVNAASLVFFIFYYPNTGMGVSNEWISWFYCFVDIRSLQQHCLSVFDYVGVRYFSDSHKRCKYTETCKVVYLLSRRKCVFIDSSVYQREGFPEYKRATFSLFLANPRYQTISRACEPRSTAERLWQYTHPLCVSSPMKSFDNFLSNFNWYADRH